MNPKSPSKTALANRPPSYRSALLIAYWFPPASNHTWRSLAVFTELKKHFGEVAILSSSNRNFLQAKEKYQDLISIPTLDHRTLRHLLRGGQTHLAEGWKNKVTFSAYHLLNSFPFNLIVGEGGFWYTLMGLIKSYSIVKKKKVGFIFSSYRPYSDHAIAYFLKRFFPDLFWVADFRDLHLDPALNETYFPRIQRWFTRKILSRADVVTTVSKGLAVHLRPFHPKVLVLRNGIRSDDAPSPVSTFNADWTLGPDTFTIAYTGSMFRDLRRPDLLLEALSELLEEQKMDRAKVRIRYAGKDSATWQHYLAKHALGDIFQSLGNISHPEALALQSSAHINLLLTYASPALKGNATGKLYEYLSARKPVLLLVNGCPDEELEEIFKETNAGLVAYNSLNHRALVKEFLLRHYQDWLQTGQVELPVSEAALANYRWCNMMKNFLSENYN